jgi:phosphatidylglycerophosphate synthase
MSKMHDTLSLILDRHDALHPAQRVNVKNAIFTFFCCFFILLVHEYSWAVLMIMLLALSMVIYTSMRSSTSQDEQRPADIRVALLPWSLLLTLFFGTITVFTNEAFFNLPLSQIGLFERWAQVISICFLIVYFILALYIAMAEVINEYERKRQ